jgi:hypothetical protein
MVPWNSRCTDCLSIYLDLSVIDHLQKIETMKYRGTRKTALQRIRVSAERHYVEIWISEITHVEMLHGIENVSDDEVKRQEANSNDQEKRIIAMSMFAQILGYPCSKTDDPYSRLDLSFRPDGEESADLLEKRLLKIPGISPGDARHLVCCAFPFNSVSPSILPKIDWFIAEDKKLINVVNAQINAGALSELAHIRFGLSDAIIEAHPFFFEENSVSDLSN